MLAQLRSFVWLVFLAWPAFAQNVRLTWVGQACFYIQTEGGPTVVVDPPAASVGYSLPAMTADVVTISHNHADHNFAAGVRGTFTMVDGRPTTARTEMTAAGISFIQIPGFHDNTNGATRGPNTIVRWTQAGIRFAHFGDYGQDELTAAQLADLRDIDVMMFPAGGFFTPDAAQMAKLIDQLKPRVAILMHFRTALGGPAQLAGHPAVTSPFPQIRYKPASLTLNRATLSSGNEVWVMEPLAEAVVVPSAGFTAGAPAGPGGIVSVFGKFSTEIGSFFLALNLPLPRKLGDTEVFIGADAVPLFYAAPNQINFQVPARQAPGQDVVEVRIGGQRVARGVLTTVPRSPGLFVAVDQEGRLNRVRRGEVVTIYGSGQGSVTPAVADGVAPAANQPSLTGDLPIVLVGGRQAFVLFSGLAPGYPGLWQINARVAADTPVGSPSDIVVWYEPKLPSNSLKIAVE